MNRFRRQLIKDYCTVAISYIVLLISLHPIYYGEYRLTESLAVVTIAHTLLLFVVLGIGEIATSCIFKIRFSYDDDLLDRSKHFLLCAAVCIPVMMCLLTQVNVILMHGIEHADYAWIDTDGSFSLKWVAQCCSSCVVAVIFMTLGMIILSEIHRMRYSMKELKSINAMLEAEQEDLRSRIPKEENPEKVILHGESREMLEVNPNDILYVESISNYLNIVYFNGSDLCQKRLRGSLKEVEEILAVFPFMAHIHRAFLVNINYITQISGNAAGIKLQLFSIDKELPVSKSNISAFREKINKMR